MHEAARTFIEPIKPSLIRKTQERFLKARPCVFQSRASRQRSIVRTMTAQDIPGVISLCEQVYPHSAPWKRQQLQTHIDLFPQGQWVAVHPSSGEIVGLCSSLIVRWEDYCFSDDWKTLTDAGYFTNHDPRRGKTLYGAEIMVSPKVRGSGIGHHFYQKRFELAQSHDLRRIRAGARLRGYRAWKELHSPMHYLGQVISGEIYDPTLTFQLHQGFKALALVSHYLDNDPESLGYAAVIEWNNPLYEA